MDKRIFIERMSHLQIEKEQLYNDLLSTYGIDLPHLRILFGYDIFDVDATGLDKIIHELFCEKNKDILHNEVPKGYHIIAFEFLPGQFDQRASAAEQCIRLLDPKANTLVRSFQIVLYKKQISHSERLLIENYLINSVESRKKDLTILTKAQYHLPEDIMTVKGFCSVSDDDLKRYYKNSNFAMSFADLLFIRNYFLDKGRDPYETELRILDTYWSDHCRHTTFETTLNEITFPESPYGDFISKTFNEYRNIREAVGRTNKPVTLMDIATINAKLEIKNGNLDDIEISDEVNAASIFVNVDVDGVLEKWLLMFKNETHNHPTEIEPYGGASTCIGGAIRDPLSGRSYVYGAMRITGAADVNEPVKDTLPGKLPQRVISKEAAHGYSSYGNQIGLATTFVEEIHHPGYKAKRMEIGAVIGAVKANHVQRKKPEPGDVIVLLGGKTGRDGIGGATGSSKVHTTESIDESSSEVQKGNAPEERKIQRLFRNPNVTKLIKKSNDFGAGGVSVAIGELADGLIIDLDKVPTKYQGINGTELAISESQERMAVVLDKDDVKTFITYCNDENIEATIIATVTGDNTLVMNWGGQVICDLDRSFIDTSGVRQSVDVIFESIDVTNMLHQTFEGSTLSLQIKDMLQSENVSSKMGLVEMFDSTIGRTTVLAPFGGKYQSTKVQSAVQLLPTRRHNTNTVSVMAYGYNPFISSISPFHGSMFAILESMAKIVCTGASHKNIRFTFQEYFEKLGTNPLKWSKPLGALLGAFHTLQEFHLAAIGGKDSMSGTYQDLDVPPTLVSFAVTTTSIHQVISPEYKEANHYLYLYDYDLDNLNIPNFDQIKLNFTDIHEQIKTGNVVSAYALQYGGLSEALIKPTFGNRIGIDINTNANLFAYKPGSIVVESTVPLQSNNAVYLGVTTQTGLIQINDATISIEQAQLWNQQRYNNIYPIYHNEQRNDEIQLTKSMKYKQKTKTVETVKVLLPVFPGTNCEYDSEDVFRQEGAITDIFVFQTQTEQQINQSISTFVKKLKDAHILMLSGGFSSGDEPDGSGKFIASVLRNEQVQVAINEHLSHKRLILGICNGFQALVKSGLLPYGVIHPIKETSPTLFKNKINRHVSKFVNTRVSSIQSPWLSSFEVGDVHTVPVSHGEGQFIVNESVYQTLLHHNQIAFQYVNTEGKPTYDPAYNPNGSAYAIEGILSKDGLILGKMAHSERYQDQLFKNIHGDKQQNIFKNAVQYFTGGINQ